jgi:hypothetical protein
MYKTTTIMKLKREKLRNFARFTDFEVDFDGKVTHLVGANGAGKSTVGMTAIWAGLRGIAEKNSTGQLIGERFRFIGHAGASADIELTLHDEVKNVDVIVKNHLTAATNQITFSGPEGYVTDPAWLNNLLNVSFLSAKNFSALSPKDQALALGIDVSDFDKKIQAKKDSRKLENAKLQSYVNLQPVEKTEKLSMQDLMEEKNKLDTRNVKNEKITDTCNYYIHLGAKLSDEYKKASVKDGEVTPIKLGDSTEAILIIPELHKRLLDTLDWIYPQLPSIDHELVNDIAAYNKKVLSADETNRKADEYLKYTEKVEAKRKIDEAIAKLDKEIDKLKTDRLEHIKKTNMGFNGLTIDDEGGLLFDEGNGARPIKEPYYSKGQLEIIVAKLYAATNPTLKVRFLDDFDSTDEENQEKILKFLIGEGFQVITSSVGKEAKHENSIILRECKIKEYNQDEKPDILK